MRPTEDDTWLDEEDVAPVLDALAAYTAPEPSPAATAALVERLRPLVPAPARRRFRADGLAASPLTVALGLLRAQIALLRPAWWVLTALVALLGPFAARLVGVPAVLLAPPLVVAGIAHAFRETGSPAAEIELSCAVRPAHLALARTLLVLGWVAGLGAVPAALLHLGHFLTWAAGLLLFGGITLVLTLWAGPRAALGLGVVAWAAITYSHTLPGHIWPTWWLRDGYAAALGAGLCAVSLLAAGRLFRLPREEA